jgi:uracil-DNA glycosylase
VIIGQDPYIKKNEAMGMCFSVPKETKVPPSLKNIYKCIQDDPAIKDFKMPSHGDLTNWAKQGVFLLNDTLTVREGVSFSHKDSGWKKFTDEVIKLIDKECSGVVFLCWGKPAQVKAKMVNTSKHHVLCTSHPSPLSAHNGFLTSSKFHFLILMVFH